MSNNKPWLKNKEVKTVEVMGAKIQLKELTFGQSRQAIKEATKIDFTTKKTEVDAMLLGVLRALYSIDSWDITGEDDKVLPITIDTFDNVLSEDFVGEIIAKVNEETDSVVTEAEKK